MKRPAFYLIFGLLIAGYPCGSLAWSLTHSASAAAPPVASPAPATTPQRPVKEVAAARPAPPAVPSDLHSTDTIDTLLDVNSPDLFARLSLWLVDASEQDIASYWTAYQKVTTDDSGVTDLIFLNWSRLNPQAAIAGAGASFRHAAWWAWGANDPSAALAAAVASKDDIFGVVYGAGQFQPAWVREHLNEIPAEQRSNAISGMTKWQDDSDPKAALDFTIANGGRYDDKTFRMLIAQDPWAAYDWAKKSGKEFYSEENRAMDTLLGEIATSQPEMLQRLADQAVPGHEKRKLEKVIFDQLLTTDPDAAMAQAAATKSPRVGAERFSAIGLSMVKSDPDQAFAMMGKALELFPNALSGGIVVQTQTGGSGFGSPPAGATELMTALIAKDPERLLSIQPQPENPSISMGGESSFDIVARTWASTAPAAMGEWSQQQQDPALRNRLTGTLVNQLQSQENYSDALQWAGTLDQNRSASVNNILQNWSNRDMDACLKWVESSNLTDDERAKFQQNLEQNHRR